jgi:hypothetical protein
MAYIGNTVQNQGFTPAIDYFNGNGVTVTFTLSRPIASVAQVIVAVDNVIQNPSSAFGVVGNSITFTSAPLSGTNNIWVEYTSLITTYQGISQDPTVIGDIRATGGYLAEGDFGNSFVDGNLIDYVTGAGRLTVGELDDLVFYHGGTSARSEMMRLSYAGNSTLEGKLTATGAGSFQGVYIGKGGGSATNNTAVGASALAATNTVGFNTAIGSGTLAANTSGASGVAIGFEAATANTTGDYNTAMGSRALYTNTTGASNTALGYNALRLNTTASDNTAVGYQALYTNATGTAVTALGYKAGFASTGSVSVYVGFNCGVAATGSSNTFIGSGAGEAVTSGAANTIVGRFNGNQGGLDIRTASNYIVLSDGGGNPRMYMNGSGNVFWGGMRANAGTYTIRLTPSAEMVFDVSSAKYKNNIRNSVYGLDAVMQLKSRQFEYKDDGRSDVGLIAEEVYEVIPELAVKNKDGEVDAVSYDRFVSVCIKAIQEQQQIITDLKARIEALEAK